MLYLYDVWVNWFNQEEMGYNVCPDYEWRKTDVIDIIEQVPCLHITEKLYDQIENSLRPIPASLLKEIYEKTYVRTGQIREKVSYACIITDGRGVLLFNTNNTRRPLKKSRLISKQAQRVIQLTKKLKAYHYPTEKKHIEKSQNHYVLDKMYMYGLTRKERSLKQLLFTAIIELKQENKPNGLWYWLSEWKETNDITVDNESVEAIWQLLFDEVKYGWSKKHYNLSKQLVKANPVLQMRWHQEMKSNQNISN